MAKKMLMIGVSALMVFTLGACGKSNSQAGKSVETDSPIENAAEPVLEICDKESDESVHENTDADSKSNILIAYFSWSGNTKQVACMIQEQTGGELFGIEPDTPYTDNINELSGISLQEQHDHIRPTLKSVVEDMSRYM